MFKIRFFILIAFLFLIVIGCGKNPIGSDVEDLLPLSQIIPMEDEMFGLLNNDRANEGLSPLTDNSELREVAREHSEDMFLRDFFSHTNPDGEEPIDRAENAGIDCIFLGENIAKTVDYEGPVEYAEQLLMESPGHRANILSLDYNSVGIGIAGDGETFYFTQLFAYLDSPVRRVVSSFIITKRPDPWPRFDETFNEAWN